MTAIATRVLAHAVLPLGRELIFRLAGAATSGCCAQHGPCRRVAAHLKNAILLAGCSACFRLFDCGLCVRFCSSEVFGEPFSRRPGCCELIVYCLQQIQFLLQARSLPPGLLAPLSLLAKLFLQFRHPADAATWLDTGDVPVSSANMPAAEAWPSLPLQDLAL